MGFFSDIIRAATSEVINAVIDGVNETTRAEEEKEMYMDEIREKYTGIAYTTLIDLSDYEGLEANERDAIKILIEERKQYAKVICDSPEEAVSTFDDEDLITYYRRLLETRGSAFPDSYAKKVVAVFQDELMSRTVAKRIYAQNVEDYFDNTRYDELKPIIDGNNIFYDEVLKKEAARELEYRNYIINALDINNIDDLENNEFMQMYALVRSDKEQTDYAFDESSSSNKIVGTYNNYFGEHRKKILDNCEREMITNRKYLIKTFLLEYCENECEEFSNYSNKKLSSIITLTKAESSDESYNYDLCDGLIAESILSERGCL